MINFKDFILSEMPISKFELLGQWGPDAKRKYGYDKKDIGILENPKAVEKIHKLWNNSKNEFDLYFLRSYAAMKYVEVGNKSREWVMENLKVDITPREDAITIIFTNNKGVEKIPMTAWAIAHRLGHAIRQDDIFERYFSQEIQKDFFEILKYVYGMNPSSPYGMRNFDYENIKKTDEALKSLFSSVGTMNSARNNKLVRSNEFVYELVAQYIITGKIIFNDLPRSLILSRQMVYGRPNYTTKSVTDETAYKEYNEMLHNHAVKYEYHLDTVFNGLEGKMFVM